jgi:hypothetical protein
MTLLERLLNEGLLASEHRNTILRLSATVNFSAGLQVSESSAVQMLTRAKRQKESQEVTCTLPVCERLFK